MTQSFDLSRYQDPLTIQRVIHGAKTIAIVGLSNNHLEPAISSASISDVTVTA